MPEVNKYGLSRYIGPNIARQIRQACGYGCVICGDAIFQYEHIDPEFAEAREHSPEHIAALCGGCHDKITRGFWSKNKVKEARQNPFCKQQGFSHSSLDIAAKGNFIVKIGSTEFVNLGTIIEINDDVILAISPPEDTGAPPRISAKFYDRNDNEIASILENEWRGSLDAFDIEAKGGVFKIRSDERQIDLLIHIQPPNLFLLEQINLAHKDARIVGNTAKGFKVDLPNASLQIPSIPYRIRQAPFWLSIKDERIALGSDYVGKYNRIKHAGYYEISNADVEVVNPEEMHSPFGGDVLKVTGREGGGKVNFVFSEPAKEQSIQKDSRIEFGRKVRRNELCPCGSGKKYKQCHGKVTY